MILIIQIFEANLAYFISIFLVKNCRTKLLIEEKPRLKILWYYRKASYFQNDQSCYSNVTPLQIETDSKKSGQDHGLATGRESVIFELSS